jgi:hypothetical protein
MTSDLELAVDQPDQWGNTPCAGFERDVGRSDGARPQVLGASSAAR